MGPGKPTHIEAHLHTGPAAQIAGYRVPLLGSVPAEMPYAPGHGCCVSRVQSHMLSAFRRHELVARRDPMEPRGWFVRPWSGIQERLERSRCEVEMRTWVVVASDTVPVVRLRAGSFETFYATRWDDVFRPLAITLRDADLAREAVDEAMARAYARWRKVRGYSNQAGWVYRVAYNWAISQKRKRRREIHGADQIDASIPVAYPNTDLQTALADLSVEQRSIVVLRYLLDWSEEDVAEALDIPKGTVKSRLNRALANLRKDLS